MDRTTTDENAPKHAGVGELGGIPIRYSLIAVR